MREDFALQRFSHTKVLDRIEFASSQRLSCMTEETCMCDDKDLTCLSGHGDGKRWLREHKKAQAVQTKGKHQTPGGV